MTESPERDLVVALSLLPFLTPSRTRVLFDSFDSIRSACNAPSAHLQELLSVTPAQAEEVRNPLTKERRTVVESLREHVVSRFDETYPLLLREICDPPLVLHFRGDLALLDRAAIAIVGSRRASPYALNAAAALTRPLAAAGLVIVSGLARGIDAAAHATALDTNGSTVAVLGTGIDVVYPRSNAQLFERIATHGLIVSEFPPGTPPRPENFPMRNRVISGLTLGTVIVEATTRSGSLITARMAAEQGREVFAVPGSIFSAGSEGTHRLIQYGAKLVHDVADIVDELPISLRMQTEKPPELPLSPLREVLDVLRREEGIHVDFVASSLKRTSGAVAESLLQLELDGWIKALPGARYVRVK
jgi:DNA processing protein